jgi:hypothetical protein
VVKTGNGLKSRGLELLAPLSEKASHVTLFNSLGCPRPSRVLAVSAKPDGVVQLSANGEALVYGTLD